MERYDYREHVLEDVREYISNNYTREELKSMADDCDEFGEKLHDEMWKADSVTGNRSGKKLKFMDKLNRMFKKALLEMYMKKVVNDNLYNIEEVEDYCSEHASATAESLTRDCISLINSNDWNAPKYNLYTFGFAMKSEHNITNKEQLLSRDDAAEIVYKWFWKCIGSYNLIYNFTDDLNNYCNA